MKKISNAIFGKESKYHKYDTTTNPEMIKSEQHYHPEYEGVLSPSSAVFPATSTSTTTSRVGSIMPMATGVQEETLLEARERPAVIHEKVFPVQREEIQPIIHRERERTEIVQVEVPRYQSEIRPTVVHERQLPAQVRPDMLHQDKKLNFELMNSVNCTDQQWNELQLNIESLKKLQLWRKELEGLLLRKFNQLSTKKLLNLI